MDLVWQIRLLSVLTLVPESLLLLTVCLTLWANKKWALASFFLTLIVGFVWGEVGRWTFGMSGASRLSLSAVLPLGALGLALYASQLQETARWVRALAILLVVGLCVGLGAHLFPGFYNPVVFRGVRFSPDSTPFKMHLNWDKVSVGIFLTYFWLRAQSAPRWDRARWLWTLKALVSTILVLIALSFLFGYVRFDPKLPSKTWLWMLNNFFFVCFAEEAFFRGFIQSELQNRWRSHAWGSRIAVGVAALLFGLAHFAGGPKYIFVATVAGIFYGWTYQRTQKIEAAMLVHFGLNLVHFLLFSYPALAAP